MTYSTKVNLVALALIVVLAVLEIYDAMASHISWSDIDNFHNVRKTLLHYPHLTGDSSVVTYCAKVKIHGTNAGVMIDSDGQVTAMSRTALLSIQNDNVGFAKWVSERAEDFAKWKPDPGDTVVIYGEWCGPGIQKGVAINQIPTRTFAVFAARLVSEARPDFVVTPSALAEFNVIDGCRSIPWFNEGEEFTIDWGSSTEALEPVLDVINRHVAAIEACDPWVKAEFGIDGVGEGLVFYPFSASGVDGHKRFGDLAFKAKGKQHQVVAHTKPVQADPTVVAGLQAFADLVVTEARLEQGVNAANAEDYDLKKMGAFLEWISKDVIKETQAELSASGLEQKAAIKACSHKARNWYLEKSRKL